MDLANEARKLDSTRLITSAIIGGPRPNGMERENDDPLRDALDVIGQNEYIGWYAISPEDIDKIHCTFPRKPRLISHLGAEANALDHVVIHQRCTAEHQDSVF